MFPDAVRLTHDERRKLLDELEREIRSLVGRIDVFRLFLEKLFEKLNQQKPLVNSASREYIACAVLSWIRFGSHEYGRLWVTTDETATIDHYYSLVLTPI